MSATYTYAPGSYAQIGFTESQNATDAVAPDAQGRITQNQESSTLYASINHKLTPKLLGSVIGRWQHSVYNEGLYANQSDDYYSLGTPRLQERKPLHGAAVVHEAAEKLLAGRIAVEPGKVERLRFIKPLLLSGKGDTEPRGEQVLRGVLEKAYNLIERDRHEAVVGRRQYVRADTKIVFYDDRAASADRISGLKAAPTRVAAEIDRMPPSRRSSTVMTLRTDDGGAALSPAIKNPLSIYDSSSSTTIDGALAVLSRALLPV